MADEAAGIPASLVKAGEVTMLGDLPLTVLSRGLDQHPACMTRQRDLLGLSSQSTQVFAHRSGHSV